MGSSIGHAIGGFFGGSSAPAESAQQPVDNYSQPGQMYQTNSVQQASGPCATDITNYTNCMTQNAGEYATQLRSYYDDPQRREELQFRMLEDKVLKILLERSTPTAPEETPEASEAAAPAAS